MQEEPENESVRMDGTERDFVQKIRNQVFNKRGGPVTDTQRRWERWFEENVLFPQLLDDSGVMEPIVGGGGDDHSGSGQRSRKGLLERILGRAGAGLIPDILQESAEDGIRTGVKYAAPIAAVLGAWWIAEESWENEEGQRKMPPVLHTLVDLLSLTTTLIATLTTALIQFFNLVPDLSQVASGWWDRLKALFPDLKDSDKKWFVTPLTGTIAIARSILRAKGFPVTPGQPTIEELLGPGGVAP